MNSSFSKDYELLKIEEDRFTSKCVHTFNPKTGTGSFSTFLNIKDLAWSPLDDSLAVSCGSNGELQRLNVMPAEIRVEAFSNRYHEKTINKVTFHPSEPKLLLTGCQDGTMKLIDLRIESNVMSMGGQQQGNALVFRHDADEKVSDIQFNPSRSLDKQFASGSETGVVTVSKSNLSSFLKDL